MRLRCYSGRCARVTPMAVKKPLPLIPGTIVPLAGQRLAEWQSEVEAGTQYRTEHFRCIDSLALLLRHGTITTAMHEAGARFHRAFVTAQLHPCGAPPLDRARSGAPSREGLSERVVMARQSLDRALDAVGGLNSPGGCALWHVVGLGCSVKEWSVREGWNGRPINVHEAKGILIAALGVLARYYGYGR